MKRILFALLLLPQLAYSQYRSDIFRPERSGEPSRYTIETILREDTTLTLDNRSEITALSISGICVLNHGGDSYVRVTLMDDHNYEYLVYENYPLLSDELTTRFTDTAIETVILDGITPKCLKVTMKDASLELESVNCYRGSSSNRLSPKSPEEIQEEQSQYIVDRLNTNLRMRNMTWRAGMTSMAEKTYEEKKLMFGGDLPQLHGFDYYAGGIFVMPGALESTGNANARSATTNTYVSNWDWRTRHGKNWMTDAKAQGFCPSCWAFAAVGAVESYVNLYYNRLIHPNLSEQELIACLNRGCKGGFVSSALNYIKNHGIVNEQCFRYNIADSLNCGGKCNNPDTLVFINNYRYITLNKDSIKKALYKNPLVIDIRPWLHSVVLTGYKKIEVGDVIHFGNQSDIDSCITVDSVLLQNLIGQTAWLLKNNKGIGWGEMGYMYAIVNTSDIMGVYSPTGSITCTVLDDDGIICSDADGDGLYFWGLGTKPVNCPSWVPDTPDGDDSDINYGSLDDYGNLDVLPNGTTIKNTVTYSSNTTTSQRIGIVNGGKLKITGTTTLTGNGKIRVCEGGILEIDGGTLQDADITMVPGCTVIIKNGGKINMASGKDFEAPLGADVKIYSGEIN